MDKQNNTKLIIALLILIIVILAVFCILFATGTISFNKNITNNNLENQSNDTNNTNQDFTSIESLNELVKINNLSIEKQKASAFGGSENNMLAVPVSFDLYCSNSSLIAGVTLRGYCLDTDDNKYSIVGPLSIMAYYCNSEEKKLPMYVNQTFDKNGVAHEVDWNPTSKWDTIDIKYCKVEKANIRLNDASEIETGIDLNYEIEFK